MIAIDSEFESLLPPLKITEYARLEQSIRTEGYHEWEPIVTWNDTIIDGHNRYHICKRNDIEFTTVEMDFESRDAAKIWVLEHQESRRNLSEYDTIAYVSNALGELYAAEAKRKQQCGQGGVLLSQKSDEAKSHIRTDERIAETASAMLGKKVSRDKVRKVQLIEAEAAKGNPTAIKAREDVRAGKKSINKARQSVCTSADKSDTQIPCASQIESQIEQYELDHSQRAALVIDLYGEPDSSNEEERLAQIAGVSARSIRRASRVKREDAKLYGQVRNGDISVKKADSIIAGRDVNKHEHKRLEDNVAVYNIDSLVTELTASVTNMRDAVTQSIEINESMGVKLTSRQKDSLNKAIDKVLQTIERMKG